MTDVDIEIGCICVVVFSICVVIAGLGLLIQQILQLDSIKIVDGEPFEVSEEEYVQFQNGHLDKSLLFSDKLDFGDGAVSVRILIQKGKYVCFWKHVKERSSWK